MPKVSVILTSYNHAKYICEAIESTLNQTFSDFELIIIDDCSSDDSWDLINQYSDSRIRAYRNEVNDGGVVGLNKAISEWARGEYIAVHHSDDVWEIDKLEIQCAFLDIHNEIGAVFTKATPIAEDGSSFLEKNHFYSDIFDQPNRTRHEWLRFFFNDLNALCHPSVLVRKSVYENCGLYRLGLVQTTDYEMWIRVCLKYEIFIIQENLVKFRVRDNEANSSGTRPETRRRGVYELYEAFHSFLGIQGSDDLFRVFPSLVRFDRGNETDIEFVLAMAAIYEKPFCSKQLFGLDFLYRIISDPVRSDKVKALYDFGLHDFTELTGKIDIFSREEVSDLWLGLQARDGQIGSLNQAVAERDGQIGSLNQAVVERDGQIGSLSQAMAEQDKLHQQTLSHIWNSTSWRLTMPLRSLGMYARRLIHIIKITPHIIKHGNEIKDTANETLLIYKNEGMDGVRRRLASLRSPAQPRSTIPDNLLSIEPQNTAEIPRIEFDQTHNRFVGYQKNPTITPMVKLIAFYLPQFHPFPENDEWWGKGFTEWTNVGRAKPNYSGHYQPHCPIHNGYYDLRVPEVMEEQARLAKEYGVYGFSYYFYWFDGKILMDTPLEMMLANKNVDMPFCFTWANENWSRRWDGQENDILIAQNHSDQDSLEFIRHLIRYFKDDRYICIEGKPVLIIYRANIIPNMAGTAKIWRDELLKNGFPGLYLVSAQSFGRRSPDPFDFDASVEFPPHTVISSDISNELDISNADYCGTFLVTIKSWQILY